MLPTETVLISMVHATTGNLVEVYDPCSMLLPAATGKEASFAVALMTAESELKGTEELPTSVIIPGQQVCGTKRVPFFASTSSSHEGMLASFAHMFRMLLKGEQ